MGAPAQRLAEQQLRAHPVLHLTAPLQQQLQVGRLAPPALPMEDVIHELELRGEGAVLGRGGAGVVGTPCWAAPGEVPAPPPTSWMQRKSSQWKAVRWLAMSSGSTRWISLSPGTTWISSGSGTCNGGGGLGGLWDGCRT